MITSGIPEYHSLLSFIPENYTKGMKNQTIPCMIFHTFFKSVESLCLRINEV